MAVLSKLGYSRVFFECWTEQYIYIDMKGLTFHLGTLEKHY